MDLPKRGESAGGTAIYRTNEDVVEVRGWFLGATDLLFEDRRTAVLRDYDGEKLHVVFLDSVLRRFAPDGASDASVTKAAIETHARQIGLAMPGSLREIDAWAVEVEQHAEPPHYYGPFKSVGTAESFAKRKGGEVHKIFKPPTFDQLSRDLTDSLHTVLQGRDNPVSRLNKTQLRVIRDRAQEALDA
jgi:hypothetical protein